ncbi:acyltransferase family protein [Microbacterium plantarum]|uniref:Acyltransferase family protein n=1 Tax=Microbacterium plantarum TaxID=1816425 RepID=A0ABV5EV92_9MICO
MSSTQAPLRLRSNRVSVPRRADIDGLRAFAIVLVVIYHVWLGRVSGGVDVFLLVSAYFLTVSFLRRSNALRPADLVHFWARRFARLIPAAAVTIFGVLGFAAAFLPGSQWQSIWTQAWASLFYVQNRELSATAVDYYARTEVFPSILQHFWSLSVQGQVFVLWPILILGAVLLARAFGWTVRTVLTVMFGVLFAVSLAYSVSLTAADQQVAYFSTPARLWEFALGSLAAILLPRLTIPASWSAILGWLGIIALVTCGIVLDVGAGFPGFAALWPTLAAVAIILAGQTDGGREPSSYRFLASAPLRFVGRSAYALYLVHWPVLVGYMTLTDSTNVGFGGGLIVIGISFVTAMLVQRAVELPVGRLMGGLRRNAAIVLASILVVAVPLGAWQLSDGLRVATSSPENNPGAAVLMPWLATRATADAPVVPSSTRLDSDWVELEGPCTGSFRPAGAAAAKTCVQTDPIADAPTFLVIGDSHVQQWLGAVLPILREDGWNVVALLKGGCAFAPGEDATEACVTWRDQAEEYAVAQSADVVMLVGTKAMPMSPDERVPYGLEQRIDALVESGSQVILMRDNPRFDFDMYRCWEDAGSETDCDVAVSDVLADSDPAADLTREGTVYSIDLTEYLCPDGVCTPVVGNVAVFLDDNHLSATYAASLSPAVVAALRLIPGIPLG